MKHKKEEKEFYSTTDIDNTARPIMPARILEPTAGLLHRPDDAEFRSRVFCVVNPSVVVDSVGCVTFRSSVVGSMLGVVDSWNIGASGAPSNWNKWSLYPVSGSLNIFQSR